MSFGSRAYHTVDRLDDREEIPNDSGLTADINRQLPAPSQA
ncbi:hypothetical protein PAMC26577_08015 [Caballeronia sordidicola]|uniref:Uncharacterized protein n=1 Tax=Caballeronia sordidicola TaxID=196367 RepID=A0A242N341_CABSO|nr:hypothetical protein PAMC26577_08015 [Caballeronia sordidicola]